MFALRNSLTLAAIWVLLLGIGIFWYVRDTKRLAAAQEEEQTIEKQLQESQTEIKRLTDVESVHQDLNEKWRSAEKVILSAEEPSFTLSYINWIMSNQNLVIDFDFVLNDKKPKGDHIMFTYTLSGEGTYRDIHKLVWHITKGPILYQISDLNLQRNTHDSEYLRFNMKLYGYTVESESDTIEDFRDLRQPVASELPVNADIFEPLVRPKPVIVERPRVEAPKLPPKLPGQIDVEKATIKAITGNSVFITEGGSGLVELRVGDPVYLGQLLNIDHERNVAVFLITKFGRSQRITLGIEQ